MTIDPDIQQPIADQNLGAGRDRRVLRRVWAFFALTFAISWGVGGLYLLLHARLDPTFGPFGPHNLFFYVAAWAPTLSALILAVAFEGARGGRALIGRLVRPFRPVWLIVAALLVPATALALTFLPMLGYAAWPVRPHAILVLLPAVLFGTAQVVTNTGPLGEELGWRGYALPRLLENWNPVTAALALGLVWTLWHVPAFFISGVMGQSLSGFGWWALDTFALSIIITWLYVHANGNVLVAGVVPHFVINGMGAVGAWLSRPPEAAALAVIATCLLIFDRRTLLRRPLHADRSDLGASHPAVDGERLGPYPAKTETAPGVVTIQPLSAVIILN
jgi:membrane protease YdiL (CAAX protease family)